MLTYQDFEKERERGEEAVREFTLAAIDAHRRSERYETARLADRYERQRNVTIEEYARTVYSLAGVKVEDFAAASNRIASNFFKRLNTQRCLYSLGNGVSFLQPDEEQGAGDAVKERLGPHFDHDVKEAAYHALIHGESYLFWNLDRIHVFKVTEFVPLWDEGTGALRAGIRFWRLDRSKPMTAVLYEEDGYTVYRTEASGKLAVSEPKRAYKLTVGSVEATAGEFVMGEENYGSLPIVPMWADRTRQSTLVGMRASIDAYDLIRSGYANDMEECAEIYWLVSNAGGMTDGDLARFRDRVRLLHIANVDSDAGQAVQPYMQEPPYQAREAFLKTIRDGIYEDFGALDVHAVAAGATNDHIDAAYQPMDENADDFEYWVGEAIVQVLALAGIDDRPEFRRNRISNQKEQVEMVVQEAQWLDQATILRKLPNISAEEAEAVLRALDGEDMARLGMGETR